MIISSIGFFGDHCACAAVEKPTASAAAAAATTAVLTVLTVLAAMAATVVLAATVALASFSFAPVGLLMAMFIVSSVSVGGLVSWWVGG